MSFRDSASFGKRHEFIAIAELIKRGFDVYQTLVDDQQIDCVVRIERDGVPSYVDIQIKARSREAQEVSWGDYPSVKLLKPRSNFVFIFYSEPLDKYWIIPSEVIAEKAYRPPSKSTEPIYKVLLAKPKRRGTDGLQFEDVPEFAPYINDFDAIKRCVL